MNEAKLSGQIVRVYPIKYTLQKLPVVSFVLEHKSLQLECGQSREVKCRVYCIALGIQSLIGFELLNRGVLVNGFLSHNAKSQLVLHISKIDFLDKGN